MRLTQHSQAAPSRRGSSAVIMIAAAGCFALVLVAAYLFTAEKPEAKKQPVAKQQVETPKAPQPVAKTPVESNVIVMNDPASEPTENVAPAKSLLATRLELLMAQLAAGEFGPALATAQTATDANERSELLRHVADAQIAAGEFHGAMFSIRQMPNPAHRIAARGEHTTEESLAGGGNGADFTQLIDLIQNETSGPWIDVQGDGGSMSEYNTGVRVDPNGLLARVTREEQNGQLRLLANNVRVADLNEDMAKPSALRLVSLTRLEKMVAERIANGQPVVTSMKHLAGLSKIQYVFVYPETGEVVIGGPAEGWKYNEQGIPVGVQSGTPTMQLDDLVTVMRTFSKDGLGIFTCSIKPRQEGMVKLKTFVEASNNKGPLTPTGTRRWAERMEKELGMQDIVYEGIPTDSRVARVIIEADYRMKLIGIGKLDGGKNIPSFFDLLSAKNAQQPAQLDALRWWLTMQYESILHSPDRNVFEVRGSSVKCLSANELINDQGQRVQTGKTEETNRLFAANFTQHYAELAKDDLVFADLQNIFDLALVGALIRQERIDQRTNWNLGVFAPNGAYHPASHPAPQTVHSVVNHRVYKGGNIVAQVAGGVRADLMAVVKNDDLMKETTRLNNAAPKQQMPEGRWWWDVTR